MGFLRLCFVPKGRLRLKEGWGQSPQWYGCHQAQSSEPVPPASRILFPLRTGSGLQEFECTGPCHRACGGAAGRVCVCQRKQGGELNAPGDEGIQAGGVKPSIQG